MAVAAVVQAAQPVSPIQPNLRARLAVRAAVVVVVLAATSWAAVRSHVYCLFGGGGGWRWRLLRRWRWFR